MAEDSAAEKRHPNLYAYLQKRLPELGLDVETYGPYVWGGDDEFDDDFIEDAAVSLTKDPEEMEGVVELLQASSETRSDDEAVWKELMQQIQEEIEKDIQHHQTLQAKAVQEKKEKMQEDLEKAKMEQQQVSEKEEKPKSSQNAVDDETKRMLMQRFGYDEPDADAAGDTAPTTSVNKQAAAEANLEKAKDLRSKQKTSKKEEQQKTKESRLNKEKAKEARRQKAQKGERKR